MEEKDPKNIPIAEVNTKLDDGTEALPNESVGDSSSGEVSATNGKPEKEGQEHTRSKMALLFVLGFFAILFLCFLYAIMVGASLTELKDALTAIVGALSGILGFIVGYYYKSAQEQ